MADSPLLDAPTCKSKVRDSTTRFTVTRTRITDDRKRSSKMVDENEKVKKRKKKRKKKKIYDPARRASSLGTRRMSRRRKKEYAVIGLATAWNKSFARFFLKKKKFERSSIYVRRFIPRLVSKGGKITERKKEKRWDENVYAYTYTRRTNAHSHATGIEDTERTIQPSNTNDHLDRDLRAFSLRVRKIIRRSTAVASLRRRVHLRFRPTSKYRGSLTPHVSLIPARVPRVSCCESLKDEEVIIFRIDYRNKFSHMIYEINIYI